MFAYETGERCLGCNDLLEEIKAAQALYNTLPRQQDPKSKVDIEFIAMDTTDGKKDGLASMLKVSSLP